MGAAQGKVGWHEPYSVPEGPTAEVFTNYSLIAGSPKGRAEGHLHGGHMFFLFVWGFFLGNMYFILYIRESDIFKRAIFICKQQRFLLAHAKLKPK